MGSEYLRRLGPKTRALVATLPPQGDWSIVKTRDHYFLYDGLTRVSCVGNNSGIPNTRYDVKNVHDIQKYVSERYAGSIT